MTHTISTTPVDLFIAKPAPFIMKRWATGAAVVWLLGAGAVAGCAWAQTPDPGANSAAAATAVAAASAATPADALPIPAAPAVPKYSASDIKTIFGYLDRNRDGRISREEAAGFKGVARNFDRADTNQDGSLSAQEFAFAMNRAK